MILITCILAILITLIFILTYRYYRINFYSWYVNFLPPKNRIVMDKNVMVAMPDGTKLATDIYRPKSLDKFPVILIRTPYDKMSTSQPYRHLAPLFASQGYVVVIQDVRGKYRSEGEFYPYAYEALDGHTTVTWAGEASWSNGKVALLGLSYAGSCAWLAARYKSVYLRTIMALFTTQNTYSIWVDEGVPFLKGPLLWLTRCCSKIENTNVTDQSLKSILWQLPVNMLDTLAVHKKILFYKEYLAHIKPDAFWEEISAYHRTENLDMPAFIIGGWYDPFLTGTIEDYHRMKQAPPTSLNQQSYLLIGPWAHNPVQKFQGIDFGNNASFKSLLLSTLDWCDKWLKDKKVTPLQQPKVRYFIMGKNEWREADQWPPSNVEKKKYFLSNQSPPSNYTDCQLTSTAPENMEKKHFIYNPRDPVLFRGGYILHGEGWMGPVEQNEIIARDDVLIYSTAPLEEELCITGSPKLILYVSSEALDTDFWAKICDMNPNGKTFNLTSGFVRMRFRESLENVQLMIPGHIYRIEILFKAVAHAFLKKHRIQLQITSSDFPSHNRNLNTGLSCESSIEIKEVEQTLYTGKDHESQLILPLFQGTRT